MWCENLAMAGLAHHACFTERHAGCLGQVWQCDAEASPKQKGRPQLSVHKNAGAPLSQMLALKRWRSEPERRQKARARLSTDKASVMQGLAACKAMGMRDRARAKNRLTQLSLRLKSRAAPA